ncbi:hypothetical protein MG293_020483, partial [Ovis ammon polii]
LVHCEDPWDLEEQAQQARDMGAKVYCVGVKDYERDQLNDIVERKDQMYGTEEFNSAETFVTSLVKNSCMEAMAGDTHFVCLGVAYEVTFFASGLDRKRKDEIVCRYHLGSGKVFDKKPISMNQGKLICPGHIFDKAGQEVFIDYSLNNGVSFVGEDLKIVSKDCLNDRVGLREPQWTAAWEEETEDAGASWEEEDNNNNTEDHNTYHSQDNNNMEANKAFHHQDNNDMEAHKAFHCQANNNMEAHKAFHSLDNNNNNMAAHKAFHHQDNNNVEAHNAFHHQDNNNMEAHKAFHSLDNNNKVEAHKAFHCQANNNVEAHKAYHSLDNNNNNMAAHKTFHHQDNNNVEAYKAFHHQDNNNVEAHKAFHHQDNNSVEAHKAIHHQDDDNNNNNNNTEDHNAYHSQDNNNNKKNNNNNKKNNNNNNNTEDHNAYYGHQGATISPKTRKALQSGATDAVSKQGHVLCAQSLQYSALDWRNSHQHLCKDWGNVHCFFSPDEISFHGSSTQHRSKSNKLYDCDGDFNLYFVLDTREIQDGLKRLQNIVPSGAANMQEGLKKANEQIESVYSNNKNASSLIFTLTAGPLLPETLQDAKGEATKARNMKTTIYAMGIKDYKRDQLLQIVQGKRQVYRVDESNIDEGFIRSIVGNSCKQVMGKDTFYACVGGKAQSRNLDPNKADESIHQAVILNKSVGWAGGCQEQVQALFPGSSACHKHRDAQRGRPDPQVSENPMGTEACVLGSDQESGLSSACVILVAVIYVREGQMESTPGMSQRRPSDISRRETLLVRFGPVEDKEPASVSNEKITCQGHIFAKTGQVIVVDYSLDLGKTYSKRFLKVTSKDCLGDIEDKCHLQSVCGMFSDNDKRQSLTPGSEGKLDTLCDFVQRCNQTPLMWCPTRNVAVSTKEKESYCVSAIQNLHSFDPFADASKGDVLLPAGTEDYIRIRIQQRNGRKTLTTVQGITDDSDKKKLVLLNPSSRVLELAHCEDPWDLEEQEHKKPKSPRL